MSLNISKSFLEVENIKLSNQGKELNYKQIENLYYKLNYLDKNFFIQIFLNAVLIKIDHSK